jgi:Na+/proline symporter
LKVIYANLRILLVKKIILTKKSINLSTLFLENKHLYMTPALMIFVITIYFLVLLGISWYTARNTTNKGFFIGDKSSPWYIVAFGMIGTSLSGVTFVSVPGTVETQSFSYLLVVLGYFIGYLVVAYVLLPIYYKLSLTSIYHFLEQRFNMTSYKTGALLFIVSRTVGATARLYLVIRVLQYFILDAAGVPFWLTAFFILLLIVAYTYKGGVKTIVWTDTLQTTFMLGGLIVSVYYILNSLDYSFSFALTEMQSKGYTKLFISDVNSPAFYLKHIIGGAFIAITMTGLDQEMMQKNISVRTLKDSQKNIISLSVILIFVNFLFLFLGGLLYLYAQHHNLALKGDDLFPTIALNHFPPIMGLVFIIALISALFPSADGAITALTASFCIDILGINRRKELSDKQQVKIRSNVHLIFAVVFLLAVMIFHWIDNRSIIDLILKLAGYTYGPLLGLFAYGVFSKRQVTEKLVPIICLLSPAICYVLADNSAAWFNGYKFGYELLIVNGALTYLGLHLVSKRT